MNHIMKRKISNFSKILISLWMLILGGTTLIVWGVGSHDNIQFRPEMMEDWLLSAIIFSSLGIPLFFLFSFILKSLKKEKKTKAMKHLKGVQ